MSYLALYLIKKEKAEKTGFLDLGYCGLTPDNPQLQKVWHALGKLTHLEVLVLSNAWQNLEGDVFFRSQNKGRKNFLNEIPITITDLTHLKRLIIVGDSNKWKISKLENLPQSISALYIDQNEIFKLENLPPNISILCIGKNRITRLENLPQSITTLEIGYNQISKLENLPQNILILNIHNNQIRKLKNLPRNILTINISHNQISKLENLPQNLNQLSIRGNQISKLENLPQNLNQLDIPENQINKLENLPQNLNWLNIRENQIKDLKPLVPLIKKGITYYVKDNPIESPPREILHKGNKAILKYFEELEKADKIPNDTLKLILIGNTTAGKTSLVKYLMYEEFNPEQSSTHGMQITAWQPEELGGININVWDFGGQEYYHATHRLFLSNNAVYVLLWEAATNRTGTGEIEIFIEGLEGRQQREYDIFPYQYWLESIRYYAKDSEVFVVQNKSAERLPISEEVLGRYSFERDKEFHICLQKADACRAQPEKDVDGWWSGYGQFRRKLLHTLRESVAKYDLVSYWVPIREAVLTREENYLSLTHFEEICQAAVGEEVEIAFDLLMIYLRDIASVILYYEEDEDLKNTVFIKPNWLNQNIYNILNYKVLDDEGEFNDAHVVHVVGALQARQFVALMKQFGLIFDLPDEGGKYVAPQYLPKTCSNEIALNLYLKSAKPQHAFTLHFPDFLPKSVMTRFLATYGSKTQNHLFWKYGICFFEEDTGVYATYEYEKNKIRIEVQNGSKRVAGWVFQTLHDLIQNDDFEVILEGQPPMLWRALLWDSRRLNPALVRAYEHLMNPPDKPIPIAMKKIFISYSKHDLEKIETELKPILRPLERQGKIDIFYDHNIPPGEEWDKMIKDQLNTADIILLMVSAKFLATDYIWDVEMKRAIERHNKGDAKVLPIILSHCDWTGDATPFSKLNALPSKGKPISKFDDENEAWTEVLQGIKKLIT